MTIKRTGGFVPKIVKPTLMQRWLHKWKLLREALRTMPKGIVSDAKGIPSDAKGEPGPSLRGLRGGKIEIRERDKSTEYNPREFRADKGPRK